MARKSRVQKRALPEEPIVQWKAGVYARVSVSDNREHGESILNQLKLAQEVLLSNPEITFVKNYIDDGYSGMNFNRPAFQSMLKDLESGIINCVIVKDISRIGRDYLGVGKLLQETFPLMEVRFVSINDNYDNVDDIGQLLSLEMIIQSVMHYRTALDISKKITSAIDAKVQTGTFLPAAGSIPYGYLRDPKNNTYAIDQEVRSIIQRIFALRAKGVGYTAIAQSLNKDKIPCPGKLKYLRGASTKASFADAIWQKNVIRSILYDQVYIGNRVHGKVKKDDLRRPKHSTDADEWTIIENAHPAIISKELFDAAQRVNQAEADRLSHYQKRAEIENDNRKLFNGRLFCGNCGKPMTSSKNAAKPGSSMPSYAFYDCSLYKTSNRTMCSSHFTRDDVLTEIIERAVAQHVPKVLDVRYILKQHPLDAKRAKLIDEIKALQEQERLAEQRLDQLIDDADAHRISDSICFSKIQAIRTKQFEMQTRREALMDEEYEVVQQINESNRRIVLCRQYAKAPKLTVELLDSLIEKIVIYGNKTICVHFKYDNECYKEIYSGRA